MSRVDDFYNMLVNNGGDTDAIADNIINDLNAAMKRYETEKKNKTKQKDAQALAEHMNSFCKIYYPDLKCDYKGSDMIDIFELGSNVSEIIPKVERKINKVSPNVMKTLEDMIAEMGW